MSFFDKQFHKEDLFIYLVALGLMIFFGYYFIESRDSILQAIQYDPKRIPPEQAYLFEMQRMKYDFGAKVLAANSLRNNMSFIVGSILCLLGTMVVIRRVRDEIDFTGNAAGAVVSLKSSSPGVFLALMGTVMIMASIIFKDKYTVNDGDTKITIDRSVKADTTKPKPVPVFE